MNTKFEIDPTLLDDAVEVMRFAVDRCEGDAAALARLDIPEAQELAQARLQMAKKADGLLFFLPGNKKCPVQRSNAGQGRNLKQSRKRSYGRILHRLGPKRKCTCSNS